MDQIFRPGVIEQQVTCICNLTQLAVSENLLAGVQPDWISDLFMTTWNIRALLIVMGKQPTLRSIRDGDRGKTRWEFEGCSVMKFLWQGQDEGFNFDENKLMHDSYDRYHVVVGETASALREVLIRERCQRFEIRPVIALER